MKRFLGVLICAIALNSCDDGDLVVDKIDFSAVQTQKCSENNLLYKLNDKESLILKLPVGTFANNPTALGEPTILDVNATNQVVYSFYTGKVASGNICDLIAPATPNVNSQWKASSGKIQIVITDSKKLDETNNSTRITGYNTNIVFKNITFDKGDGTSQFYETFAFGDYTNTIVPLPFGFNELLNICSATNQVYKFSESESFTLNIDKALIANEVTAPNVPRTGVIGATVNKLAYSLFNIGVVTADYFCKATIPSSPVVSQEWLGKIGGIIEVTTTTSGPTTFKHTITLKNVTLVKGNSNFQLGTSYKFGELQTTK
jgi:hypothetical protein